MKNSVSCQTVDFPTMRSNALHVLDCVGFGNVAWYAVNHRTLLSLCATMHIDIARACGVVAAVSPCMRWDKNLSTAVRVISDHNLGRLINYEGMNKAQRRFNGVSYMQTPDNVVKAIRILSGESPLSVLGGLKVSSFYDNLLHPYVAGAVTIDRHMLSILRDGVHTGRSGDLTVTDKMYRNCASVIISLALELSDAQGTVILPHELQASLWIYKAARYD